jgi:CRP-like cAMP-binding protein/Fe-S-cluster-containing hydrogenase component 2
METYTKEHFDKIPLFSGVDHNEILPLLKDCVIRTLGPGEIMYNCGDYGDDCGILLSGSINVEFPQETGSDSPDKKVVLREGDIFGEIAALSGYVRTADVTAADRATVLVMSKGTLLNLFDKFPPFKNRIDELYRRRVLSHQLKTAPIFMGLPGDLVERLAEKSSLRTCAPGETVFRQDDDADAFYMVRYGFIKVTESSSGGGSRVLAYLKGGHYFGEMALLSEGGKRTATVTAIDRTELVRVSGEDFRHIIESYPRVRAGLEKIMEKTKEKNLRIRQDEYLERTMSSVIESGFVRSKEVLVIDLTKCIQCNSCINACGALHDDQSRLVRKGMRLSNILLIAASCRHCDDPTCMIKCPTGSINRGSAGEIYYGNACIGCGKCARNCPYNNITMVSSEAGDDENRKGFFSRYFNRESGRQPEADDGKEKKRRPKKKPAKCDMCREYPFMACVYNCPTGAARRLDPVNFINDVIGAG